LAAEARGERRSKGNGNGKRRPRMNADKRGYFSARMETVLAEQKRERLLLEAVLHW
jgi:hypothetical protein